MAAGTRPERLVEEIRAQYGPMEYLAVVELTTEGERLATGPTCTC